MAAAPVVFEELFTLPSVGISPTHISFSSGGLSVHQQPLERCLLACWVKRYFTGE
jgi:hypothetical protein